ncbi:HBL/NHE enterotoxin family protein [Tumebacillus permanentifrigoris]|uniref:Hemolytic enterotoxin HBL n=1 Tax=Tumebacillus permanentifrigoris TaxID=378543 RepID=A0A316D7J0_9BACL|nr:HBL/NHE enterotoxin family protein [Tumebacillus permanentifrigoris]PWK11269.1 hemolytic enterotoxin HBL [Tumebacillus permanentifrigoris]
MIAHQVRKLAPSTEVSQQVLVDYINACTLVSAYVYGFTNASVTALQDPPVWFSSFVQKFGIAKGHALQWNSSIVPQLLVVPQNVSDMNKLVQSKLTHISELLKQLQANPQDTAAKQEILNQLDNIHDRIVSESALCTQLTQSIETFNVNTRNDYGILKQGLDACLHQIDVDEAEMSRLKREIETLTADIQACSTKLTASEVGAGISIFICLVGIVVTVETAGAGATLIGVGVTGLTGSIGAIIALKQQIQADQSQISKDTANLNTISCDVIALSANTEMLQQVCTANQQAQQALNNITSLWNGFAVGLKELRREIEVLEADLATQDINGAISELALVQNDWNQLDTFAGQLADIDYKYNPNINNIK